MKILAVCGLGMGTSLILRMNIEEVLRNSGTKASVEHSDVSSAKSMNYDYVVTSTELAQAFSGNKEDIIVVNNFTDKEEIRKAFEKAGII